MFPKKLNEIYTISMKYKISWFGLYAVITEIWIAN